MKKLILLALTALMMVGCEESEANRVENSYKIIIIDSCEYIEAHVTGYAAATFPVHKSDCRYCEERRKQELKELVKLLKDK